MNHPENISASAPNLGHDKTVLLVGDDMGGKNDLIASLVENGYRFVCATTEQLLDGAFLTTDPQAAVVSYNWPNNIGLRAFLLNHHALHSLPVIFSGSNSAACPGRDLNVIGHSTHSQSTEIIELLNRYFSP